MVHLPAHLGGMDQPGGSVSVRRWLARLRFPVEVLLKEVRREAVRADLRWIGERLKTPGGRRQLHKALQRAV